MESQMAEAIQQLMQEKGVSREVIVGTVESVVKAAYKRTFGTSDNAVVKVSEDLSDVAVYSRKVIVVGVYDPATEIELEDALKLSSECEVGDEMDILVDPKDFTRSAIQTGKQTARQSLSEIHKNSMYAEYRDKIGEIIVGYYQREWNGNIYVDLGKTEGILSEKNQSPRESYHKSDRIRALISDLKRTPTGVEIVLTRASPDFVRAVAKLEIPEIYDKTVDIYKIVREPGYRTKMSVYSGREDIDPVGACVGQKGVRIQSIIRELEGEKIDVLKYDADPRVFIRNALVPAEPTSVVILNEERRQAVAVVPDQQLSLAIGKQGMNVRLANRLTDWNIDVKTESQYKETDSLVAESRKTAENLFATFDEYEEIDAITDLPGVDERVCAVLAKNGMIGIEQFLTAVENKSIYGIQGIPDEDIRALEQLISESVEIFENSTDGEAAEVKTDVVNTPPEETETEESYECPDCSAKITADMTACPACGVGLSFEFEG